MSEQKISPYSLNDLKNTTDDALGNYLRSLSFKQDNTKTDVKLAVGWTAVIIAGVLFTVDYKLGWEKTKPWTLAAVLAYSALNSFFTYWLYFVEKGLVFEGTKNGKKISIRSKTNKHEPTYYLTVTGSTTKQLQAPFTTWFTSDGFFASQPFQQWLASSIEVIGDVDGKNAMRDQRDNLAAPVKTTGMEAGSAVKRKKERS